MRHATADAEPQGAKHSHRVVFSNLLPDFQCHRAASRILERARRRIRSAPGLAEIIGVDANRRAVRLFIGKIRDGRFAEQIGGYRVCAFARRPRPCRT